MTNPTSKTRETIRFLTWICNDCGERYGKHGAGHGTTWHQDDCGICGREKAVANPRDFGHLLDGWAADVQASTPEK